MVQTVKSAQPDSPSRTLLPYYLLALVAFGLYASSFYSYLLFHSLVEVAGVIILLTIFILAWNARNILDNHYILFLGISFLSSAAFELMHLFAFKGFGVFANNDANLPTQLWIVYRYVFSLSFLIAPVFITRRLHSGAALTFFAAMTALLFAAIFAGVFPDCFVEGQGLTPFKIYSEFVIIGILLAALALLIGKRDLFDPHVLRMLGFSVISAAVADAAFTQYLSVYGPANLVGHLFLFLSAVMIYKAIVVTGIEEPRAVIFRNLEQSEERFRLIAETSIDLIFQLDPTGKIVFCSPAISHYGYAVADVLGKDFRTFVAPDNLDQAVVAFQQVMGGRILHGLELLLMSVDGTPFYTEINVAPITANGTITGIQGISRNVTARKEAEEKLKKFATELQDSNVALADSRTAAFNLMQDAVTARTRAETINAELLREVAERKQIERELKKNEEQVKASLAEKEVMLREIHHRVKNNLQVISSLISLQVETQTDERMRAVFGDVRDRVRTMALVHERLYQTGDMAKLNFAEYATSLLQYLWRAHGALAEKVRLDLVVAPVALPIETAVPCGLILNELAGNALKHAFPGGTGGEVTVRLDHDPATGAVCLRVHDNGVGLSADRDWRQSSSLGLRLVQILAGQLHGAVATGAGPGTEFSVTFALNRFPS